MNAFIGGMLVGVVLTAIATVTALRWVWITRIKALEAELRVSRADESLMRDVVESASEWIWETDHDHRFIDVACPPGALQRQDADRFLGQRRMDMAERVPGDEEMWRGHQADLDAHRPFRDLRYAVRDNQGALRHLRVSGKPVFAADGGFLGYRGMAMEITAAVEADLRAEESRRLIMDALRQARDEAEQANLSKTRFLAAASHDLRQPLQALGLFVATLSHRALPEDLRKIVDRIESSLEALEHLLDTLLDMSRLDAGVVKAHMASFPLQSLFDRVALEFGPLGAEKGLRIRFLPTDASVCSDPALLERILRNLLSNAIRYTDRGGILVGVRRRGDHLRVEIRDTGKGIPDDQQQEIFREFHQIGGHIRDRRQGLGLGLAIVDRLAGLLGHDIQLQSTLGRGSCFTVLVPLAGAATAVRALPTDCLSGRFVVVVNDDPVVRDGLKAVLDLWGCRVVTAAGVDDAMAAVEQAAEMPSAIIADCRQRGNADGAVVVDALRSRLEEEIPAVLITTDETADSERHGGQVNLRLLQKPVRPDALREALQEALEAGQLIA